MPLSAYLRVSMFVAVLLTALINPSEEDDEDRINKKQLPIDGGWTRWSIWQPCYPYTRDRLRFCQDPEPQYGGAQCVGKNKETDSCIKIVSVDKIVSISSNTNPDRPHSMVDGLTDTCMITEYSSVSVSAEIYLMGLYEVNYIVVHFYRQWGHFEKGFSVAIAEKNRKNPRICYSVDYFSGKILNITSCVLQGEYVIWNMPPLSQIHLCEIIIYGNRRDLHMGEPVLLHLNNNTLASKNIDFHILQDSSLFTCAQLKSSRTEESTFWELQYPEELNIEIVRVVIYKDGEDDEEIKSAVLITKTMRIHIIKECKLTNAVPPGKEIIIPCLAQSLISIRFQVLDPKNVKMNVCEIRVYGSSN